jgi:hypothetical protein
MSRNPIAGAIATAGTMAPMTVAPAAAGFQSETIVLETRDFDLNIEDPAPTTVDEKHTLKNFVRGITTELAIFRENYVLVREKRKGKRVRSALIDLQYLDRRPALLRQTSSITRYVALLLIAGALLAGALASMSFFPLFCALVAVGLTGAAGVTLWIHARGTTETVAFRTAEGRVPVLVLRANLGCIGACRALVPSIVEAITEARRAITVDRSTYLRREMREHYRLQEIGVLTANTCTSGTRRILAQFDSGIGI